MKQQLTNWQRLCLVPLFTTLALPAANRVLETGDFSPTNWTAHVFPLGWGGSATNYFRTGDGWPGAHLETRITVNAPSSTQSSLLHTITLNGQARHDPANDGEIFAVNYQEYARVF